MTKLYYCGIKRESSKVAELQSGRLQSCVINYIPASKEKGGGMKGEC